ncbi:mechanosensitive ion channel family protein [Chloroflexota bacterium]
MPAFDFNLDLAALIAGALKVVVILVIALIIVLVVRRVIPKLIKARIPKIREEAPDQLAVRSKTLSQVIAQVVSAIIWIVALIMILSVLGVNIAPLIAGIGVAGLALGFAAQNIVRDYLHGFFIIMEDWYRVGEVAVIQGTGGLVENITLRRTILRDLNGTLHIFPNSRVDQASNMTRDWSRVNLDISVAYKENLDNVIRVINEVGQGMKDDPTWGPDLLTAPAVTRVNNLGDNGVEIKILADTKPIKQWGLMGELRKRLKNRFDEEDIEIPWPHTKVYFGNAPGGNDKD